MIADSHAPVPDPGNRKTVPFSDLKTFLHPYIRELLGLEFLGFFDLLMRYA
jgi:hypothetical protein